MTAIAIVSGGMDSVTLAYLLDARGETDLTLVSFVYGQRHWKEVNYAAIAAGRLEAQHEVVQLPIGRLLTGSALTDPAVNVPDGHYTDETMRDTVVPNRNMIMLSIAAGIAVARKAGFVATAVHAGDHAIYPDCRPEFVDAMTRALVVGNDGFAVDGFHVLAPFVHMTKTDIARVGDGLGVPWADTWSCYKGGLVHCGTCGTCVERREAFADAGVDDPTEYEATT